jgi:hypothetical protein
MRFGPWLFRQSRLGLGVSMVTGAMTCRSPSGGSAGWTSPTPPDVCLDFCSLPDQAIDDCAVLESLPDREGVVFARADGGIFSRDTMYDAWQRTLQKTGVRRIRPYDLRHTFASLLIAAGKNPLYIAQQMGHYSAGFTLDTYGHLMDNVPRRQVEFIDELVFPEGWQAALKLHLCDAPRGAAACSPMPPRVARKPLKNQENRGVVQQPAAGGLVPPARFELALPA